MADECNNSNPPPTLLAAAHDTTNQNPTPSESVFTGSWGSSSSSLFSTSFGSELDSSETDNDNEDDDFIAELTRQMADYMLQEDDGDDSNDNNKSLECFVSPKSSPQVKNLNQNQHRVEMKSRRRRKGKMPESTQQVKSSGLGHGPFTPVGSGMRAIFLNGSGSNSRSGGTGVFLPRSATDATAQYRKKPGCSTVLVPTRVLQALEQHFNNKDSPLSSSNVLHIQPHQHGQRSGLQQKLQVRSTSSDLDRKLPQEWTY